MTVPRGQWPMSGLVWWLWCSSDQEIEKYSQWNQIPGETITLILTRTHFSPSSFTWTPDCNRSSALSINTIILSCKSLFGSLSYHLKWSDPNAFMEQKRLSLDSSSYFKPERLNVSQQHLLSRVVQSAAAFHSNINWLTIFWLATSFECPRGQGLSPYNIDSKRFISH